jgi:hypothetical protein
VRSVVLRAGPWPILGVLALSALAQAARAPDTQRAEELVVELQRQVGSPDAAWLRQNVQPRELERVPRSMSVEFYAALGEALREGGALDQLSATAIAGSVRGPDYVRVVLEGSPPVTVVVRRVGGELVVDGIEDSACGLCSEPERFVADLVRELSEGGARPRLVPGLDLLVDPSQASSRPESWIYAMHARNVEAGYVRYLLRDAEVVGASGMGVDVALSDRTETWPVVYSDDRWMVDYAGLPEDSPLRMDDSEIESWQLARHLAAKKAEWWLPTVVDRPPGARLLAEDVLVLIPRPLQGDVLIYSQDLDRSFALAALIDPDDGSVLARRSLPTLSKKQNYAPEDWRGLFHAALSPDGRRLAVGAHKRMWLIELGTGEVQRTWYDLGGLAAVDWSEDGRWLVLGDQRGVSLIDATTLQERGRYWGETLAPIEGLSVGSSVLAVHGDGVVVDLEIPGLQRTGNDEVACCGSVRGVDRDPRTGDILCGCAGTCEPVWLWRWSGDQAEDPVVRADEDIRAAAGALSVDPTGRWLVSSSAEAGAVLWDLRSEQPVTHFAERPLRQVSWDIEADRLYAVDVDGRAWMWSLSALAR